MFRLDLRLVAVLRDLDGAGYRLACLLRVLVDVHDTFSSFCSASKCTRCSGVSERGNSTLTVAYKSAGCALAPTAGMPWPFNRKTCPFCVDAGTFRRSALPARVGTSTSPPST